MGISSSLLKDIYWKGRKHYRLKKCYNLLGSIIWTSKDPISKNNYYSCEPYNPQLLVIKLGFLYFIFFSMFYTLDKTHPNIVTFNSLEKVKEVTISIK
jgi:hypothetical protein